MSGPLKDRILSHIKVDGLGCWNWTMALHVDGYGKLRVDGATLWAHRVAYEAFVGPIPHGMQLDHLCRNRACVNPAHLEPVTSRENTLRSPIHAAAINARKTECCRGHLFTDQNTAMVQTGRGRVGRRCLTCYPGVKGRAA